MILLSFIYGRGTAGGYSVDSLLGMGLSLPSTPSSYPTSICLSEVFAYLDRGAIGWLSNCICPWMALCSSEAFLAITTR